MTVPFLKVSFGYWNFTDCLLREESKVRMSEILAKIEYGAAGNRVFNTRTTRVHKKEFSKSKK